MVSVSHFWTHVCPHLQTSSERPLVGIGGGCVCCPVRAVDPGSSLSWGITPSGVPVSSACVCLARVLPSACEQAHAFPTLNILPHGAASPLPLWLIPTVSLNPVSLRCWVPGVDGIGAQQHSQTLLNVCMLCSLFLLPHFRFTL